MEWIEIEEMGVESRDARAMNNRPPPYESIRSDDAPPPSYEECTSGVSLTNIDEIQPSTAHLTVEDNSSGNRQPLGEENPAANDEPQGEENPTGNDEPLGEKNPARNEQQLDQENPSGKENEEEAPSGI